MLEKKYDVVVKTNQKYIEICVMSILQKWQHEKIRRLHFHYSGHGINNRIVNIPKATIDNFHYDEVDSSSIIGECMVGSNGDKGLCAVLTVQKLLTILKPEVITMTLDCCRNQNRSQSKSQLIKLPELPTITSDDWSKMATLSSTCQTLTSSDFASLSNELEKVHRSEGRIKISEMAKKVNESWEKSGISQRCKMDYVQLPKWDELYWPL